MPALSDLLMAAQVVVTYLTMVSDLLMVAQVVVTYHGVRPVGGSIGCCYLPYHGVNLKKFTVSGLHCRSCVHHYEWAPL